MKNKKRKKEYSDEDKINAILWGYLKIDREQARELLLQQPWLTELSPSELNARLHKLCYEYLVPTEFIKKQLWNNPQDLLDISTATKMEQFFCETFNLSRVEYGQVLSQNKDALDLSESEILKIASALKTKCNMSDFTIKRILITADYFAQCTSDEFVDELITKTKILTAFGVPIQHISATPAMLGNTVENTLDKLILFSMSGRSIKGYSNYKYMLKKERAYARLMASFAHEIDSEDVYVSEWSIKTKYGYTTNDLMEKYPFDDNTHQALWNYLANKNSPLAESVKQILDETQNQSEQ